MVVMSSFDHENQLGTRFKIKSQREGVRALPALPLSGILFFAKPLFMEMI